MKDDAEHGQEIVQLTMLDELPLAGTQQSVRVTEGFAHLYVCLHDEAGRLGLPHYIATLRPGDIAIAMPDTVGPDGLRATLSLVAQAPLTLTQPRAVGAVPDITWREAVAWCQTLARDLAQLSPPGVPVTADPPADVQVAAGDAFRPAGSALALVSLSSGEAQLCGVDSAIWRADDNPILVNHGGWLVSGEDGALANLQPLPDEDQRRGAMPAAHQTTELWLAVRQHHLATERARETARLAAAGERHRQELAGAVAALRFTDSDTARKRFSTPSDPLAAALMIAGDVLGVPIDPAAAGPETLHSSERVSRALEKSGGRARRVNLTGSWTTGDAGVILAFARDGTPRLFVPRAHTLNLRLDYERIDLDTGAQNPVTPDDIADLQPSGYSFIAALPDVRDEKKKANFLALSLFAIRPQLPDMKVVMALILVSTALTLLVPVAHFIIIDKVIPNDERALLIGIGIGVAALTLCTFAFGMAQSFVNLRIQFKLHERLQASIIDRLIRLPSTFFRTYPTGELLKRALMITDVAIGLLATASSALAAAIGIVLMLALCFYYSTKLAFLALASALAGALVTVVSSFLMRRRNIDMQLQGGRNLGVLMQLIQGVSKLQGARAEERAFRRWAEGKGELLRMEYANARIGHTASLLTLAVTTLSTIALFAVAGGMALESRTLQSLDPLAAPLLTIGVFFAFQRAFVSVGQFMADFFISFVDGHEQLLKRELVRPILEADAEIAGDRVDPGPLKGRVELRGIHFRFTPAGAPVLQDVSLDAHDGEFVAIVGPSGAGKSTIVSLLLGFETPTAGVILYDGQPTGSLDMRTVRRQIGVVMQNEAISGGTLYQAIAGASAISFDDAWLAARDAGLADDIKAMPMGMMSLLPEGAGTLSGGQRQRLSIARALAQNPRIMIFDEATSALDNRSQAIIVESLRRRQITRIVIAHRLSSIADADRVFVLDRGRVVEAGAPATLRAAGGLFAKLSKHQDADEAEPA